MFESSFLNGIKKSLNPLYSCLEQDDFWKILPSFQLNFDENQFVELPLYEKMEYAIQSFKLIEKSDAYVQFFLDEILHLQQKEYGVQDVLEYSLN